MLISIGQLDTNPTPDLEIDTYGQVIAKVFHWISELPPGRKTRVEGQLLSALHLILPKFIHCIPLPTVRTYTPSSEGQVPTRTPSKHNLTINIPSRGDEVLQDTAHRLALLSVNAKDRSTNFDAALHLTCCFIPLIPFHPDPVQQASLLSATRAALDRLPDKETVPSGKFLDLDTLRNLSSLCGKFLVRLPAKPLEASVLRELMAVLQRGAIATLKRPMADAVLPQILRSVAQRIVPLVPTPSNSAFINSSSKSTNSKTKYTNDGNSHQHRGGDNEGEAEEKEEEEGGDWDEEDDVIGGEEVMKEEAITLLSACRAVDEKFEFVKILNTLPANERYALSWCHSLPPPSHSH